MAIFHPQIERNKKLHFKEFKKRRFKKIKL